MYLNFMIIIVKGLYIQGVCTYKEYRNLHLHLTAGRGRNTVCGAFMAVEGGDSILEALYCELLRDKRQESNKFLAIYVIGTSHMVSPGAACVMDCACAR